MDEGVGDWRGLVGGLLLPGGEIVGG